MPRSGNSSRASILQPGLQKTKPPEEGGIFIKKLKLAITPAFAGKRLDFALPIWLSTALGRSVSKAKARKLIMAGMIRLNGRPVRLASKILAAGEALEAYVDVARLFDDAVSRDRKFELTPDRILFEDDDLIAVDKPPGLPSHPTVDESRQTLVSAVKRLLSTRDRIENPYIGTHQRLDRDTSGVVLFTKSQRVNLAVAEIFSGHQAVKIYQALTALPQERSRRGKLRKKWIVRNYLGKISSKSKPAKYGAVRSNGVPAETAFRVVEEYRRGVWIEAIPTTGRTHQIRVHLAECGLPILGDNIYGSCAEPKASRLMLHAAELRFPHPISRLEVSVKSPLPPDFLQCLDRLK